jgi:nitrite reductase (NADH) large subunit
MAGSACRRPRRPRTRHSESIAATGCPPNCAEATVKDIGAVEIEGGKREIYVGGAAGASVRKGDLLWLVDSQAAVLRMTGRFIQYHREQAKYQERAYGFVERVGIDAIRRVLVDDIEGISPRLDAAIQASIDAYRDPWLEAKRHLVPSSSTSGRRPGTMTDLRSRRTSYSSSTRNVV